MNVLCFISQDEELKSGSSSNWMSVIKEALEMSNGIELEPGLSCSTSMVYEEPFARGVEPVKDHFGSVDYRCPDVHEEPKIEVNSAQDSSVVVLSDATKISSVKLNQDVQRVSFIYLFIYYIYRCHSHILSQMAEFSFSCFFISRRWIS